MYVGSRKLVIKIRSHQENIVLYSIIVIKTSKMTVKKRRSERVPSVTRGRSYFIAFISTTIYKSNGLTIIYTKVDEKCIWVFFFQQIKNKYLLIIFIGNTNS